MCGDAPQVKQRRRGKEGELAAGLVWRESEVNTLRVAKKVLREGSAFCSGRTGRPLDNGERALSSCKVWSLGLPYH